MSAGALAFAGLLEQLDVPRGGVVYVQSSADWIQRGGFELPDVLHTLRDWGGATGTLVMPTYPFRTTHLEYLKTGPCYDVQRTPAAVGLMPEIFRRSPGAVRSLDPDFSVAAIGPQADDIALRLADDADPFGLDSPYQRMLDRQATLVGLGVSLNTNSFIHVIDSRMEPAYGPVYASGEFSTTVIDASGGRRDVMRRALRPEFQTKTEPAAIAELIGDDARVFASRAVKGALFFRWNLAAWYDWALVHATRQIAARERPCWLRRFA